MIMKSKIISPKQHVLLDYALVGSLLILPRLLKLNKKVISLYACEAAALLPYLALTSKGIIRYRTHRKIDPYNVAQFALQSLLPAVRRSKKALLFNVAFTAVAGLTVLLTDWKAKD
jgi:hypothetical protein